MKAGFLLFLFSLSFNLWGLFKSDTLEGKELNLFIYLSLVAARIVDGVEMDLGLRAEKRHQVRSVMASGVRLNRVWRWRKF